jgi:hypothetical protein
VDAPALGLTVADEEKNIRIWHYAPEAQEAQGGAKLVCRAEFHLVCSASPAAAPHFLHLLPRPPPSSTYCRCPPLPPLTAAAPPLPPLTAAAPPLTASSAYCRCSSTYCLLHLLPPPLTASSTYCLLHLLPPPGCPRPEVSAAPHHTAACPPPRRLQQAPIRQRVWYVHFALFIGPLPSAHLPLLQAPPMALLACWCRWTRRCTGGCRICSP